MADLIKMSYPQLSEIQIKKQKAHYSMNVIKKTVVYLPVILNKPELPDQIDCYIDDQRRNNIAIYRFVNRWLMSI